MNDLAETKAQRLAGIMRQVLFAMALAFDWSIVPGYKDGRSNKRIRRILIERQEQGAIDLVALWDYYYSKYSYLVSIGAPDIDFQDRRAA